MLPKAGNLPPAIPDQASCDHPSSRTTAFSQLSPKLNMAADHFWISVRTIQWTGWNYDVKVRKLPVTRILPMCEGYDSRCLHLPWFNCLRHTVHTRDPLLNSLSPLGCSEICWELRKGYPHWWLEFSSSQPSCVEKLTRVQQQTLKT